MWRFRWMALGIALAQVAYATDGTTTTGNPQGPVVEMDLPPAVQLGTTVTVNFSYYNAHSQAVEADGMDLTLPEVDGAHRARFLTSTWFSNAFPYDTYGDTNASGTAFATLAMQSLGPVELCAAVLYPDVTTSCLTTEVVGYAANWGVQPTVDAVVPLDTDVPVTFQLVDPTAGKIAAALPFTAAASVGIDGCALTPTGSFRTDANGAASATVRCKAVGSAEVCVQLNNARTLCATFLVGTPAPGLHLQLTDVPDAGIRPGTRVTVALAAESLPASGATLQLDLAGLQAASLCVQESSGCTLLPSTDGGYPLPGVTGYGDLDLLLTGYSVGAVGAQGGVSATLEVLGAPVAQDSVTFGVKALRENLGCSSAVGAAPLLGWMTAAALAYLRGRRRRGKPKRPA